MEDRLAAWAAEDKELWKQRESGDSGRRMLQKPLVLLVLGDRSRSALEHLYEHQRTQWTHPEGVSYLFVSTAELEAGGKPAEHVLHWQYPLPQSGEDKRSTRAELPRTLYEQETRLRQLNVVLRQLTGAIGDKGRLYGSLQQVHLAVVVSADDPYSSLLPEITVLARTVLAGSFRSVSADLFVLMREKQTREDYAYDAALTVSFLKELELMQSRTFRFEAPLLVTADGIKLRAEHAASPLFETVYLLGDKDERGLFARDNAAVCSEIISRLSFLRCRQPEEAQPAYSQYNHQLLLRNLMSPGASQPQLATAGLAKVARPDQSIVSAVLLKLHRRLVQVLREHEPAGQRDALAAAGLEADHARESVDALLQRFPDPVEEMRGLLYEPLSEQGLGRTTLRQAETAWFGTHARDFFERFAERLREELEAESFSERLRRRIEENVVANRRFGLWAAFRWTSEEDRQGIAYAVREWRKELEHRLASGRAELEAAYEESLTELAPYRKGVLRWFGGRASLKALVDALLQRVYRLRLELLKLKLKRELLVRCERMLEEQHRLLGRYVEQLGNIELQLEEACRLHASQAGDGIGRNVQEYYGQAVELIGSELETRWGKRFELDERRMGHVTAYLDAGNDAYLKRLMLMAEQDWFAHSLFCQPFERELLERANVNIRYENRQVLTKEELYEDLCSHLEQEAAVRADVYRFTQKHRYEESYLFGDADSELIRYALSSAERTQGKLGCIHDGQRPGVEKLKIMGGFRTEDLMVYRSGEPLYEQYVKNGYKLHRFDWETMLGLGLNVQTEGGEKDG
ncbi:hypothetical protein RAC89_20250 [Paenibacillus sp. GD4]|uniref:hypothetical protein n=1 Tax=Paenibacillus sp. GD4 TaxID=3068890 RepID=UPI00279656DE|nr:hypothetical protein [Paenibacillus sp. GD4]MDQ1912725.1 hypothetical protein [Paenibacillus sp. GD4]